MTQHENAQESLNFFLCQLAKIGPSYMGQANMIDEKKAYDLYLKLRRACPYKVKDNGRLKRSYGRAVTEWARTLCGTTIVTDRHIEIAKMTPKAMKFRTMAHETAHMFLHHDNEQAPKATYAMTSTTREMEADLTAWVVCDCKGIAYYDRCQEYETFYNYTKHITNETIERVLYASEKILELMN